MISRTHQHSFRHLISLCTASILLLTVSTLTTAAPLGRVVEASGSGPSRENALQAAQRTAVEEAVGMVIGGESLVRNYALLSNLVQSKTSGYISEYTVLEEHPGRDGNVEVTIRAHVEPLLDQLLADQQARDLLLAWLRKPSVELQISEDNVGDTGSSTAATVVGDRLKKYGFRVIEPGPGIQPDLILKGLANARQGATPEVMRKAKMVSVQADVSLSMVQFGTWTLLATHSAHAAAPHIDPKSAGTRAITEASEVVIDSLLNDVVRSWALERVNSMPVQVTLSGVGFDAKDALLDQLRGGSGVRAVYEKSFGENTLTCIVDLAGTSDLLARSLDGITDGMGNQWHVANVTWGRVDLDRGEP